MVLTMTSILRGIFHPFNSEKLIIKKTLVHDTNRIQ